MRTFHGVTLSWTQTGDVLELELHRAPCNEIGTTTLRELEALAEYVASGADGARALITHSTRRAGFSAGADLRELYAGLSGAQGGTVGKMLSWLSDSATGAATAAGPLSAAAVDTALRGGRRALTPYIVRRVRSFLERIHAVFDTLDMAPMITVAATHGVVFGGGFELALVHDVLIADKSARFAFPELRLGLVPGFGGIPRLERDVGNAVVRDVLLTGRSLNARRAHELGLVSQVTARGKALDAARAVAQQALRFDPEVARTGKRFAKKLPRARLDEEIETFLELVRSPRVTQALHRFVHSTDVRPYLP